MRGHTHLVTQMTECSVPSNDQKAAAAQAGVVCFLVINNP